MKVGQTSNLFTAKDGQAFILRALRESELEDARQLSAQIFKEDKYTLCTITEKYRDHPSLFIGCFDDERIIGIVFGWPDPHILVIKAIAVVESHRRKGIGTALLRAFEEAAQVESFEEFVLGAEWKAVPFYLSYGLDCFANVQITPNEISWDKFQTLRSKYDVTSAVVFESTLSSVLVSRLKRELEVDVKSVKSNFESISIQIKPKEISKESLEEMKKDFNAYATQFAFKKSCHEPKKDDDR